MKYRHLLLAAFWTLLALVVLWQYDPIGRKLDADASFMLYAGQQILRGHAPYVGVAIVKLPVSPLVAALGIGAGRLVGLDDILAGRIPFWLCAALSVGATYFIGVQLAPALISRRALVSPSTVSPDAQNSDWIAPALLGSLAAVALLSFQSLGIQVAEGPEAKLPMICAGLVSLALIARQKFLWAGIAAALAFLAWQPGLVFVAAALIAALVVPNRKRAFLAALGGIALPLVLIGLYLTLNGAFASMLRQTFGANANYFEEKKVAVGVVGVVISNLTKLWDVSLTCAPTETPLIYLGFLGMLAGAIWLIYLLLTRRSPQLFLCAFPLLLSGAALFGFTLIDLQKCSDVVPLLPYFALGAAGVLFVVLVLITNFLAPRLSQSSARLLSILGITTLILLFIFGASDAFQQPRQNGLAQQRALAAQIGARLQPTDTIQQFGDTLFLISTQRENATRFVHLGEKQGLGIFTAEGISMDKLIQQIQAANPRVITLSRAKGKTWAQPFYEWVNANYTLTSSFGTSDGGTQAEMDVYLRK